MVNLAACAQSATESDFTLQYCFLAQNKMPVAVPGALPEESEVKLSFLSFLQCQMVFE